MMKFESTVLAAALAAAALPAAAFGQQYAATLDPLNNSGVTADVQITVDPAASTIRVQYQATGFDPLTLHPGHIHGLFVGGPQTSGNPPAAANSVSPTLANDAVINGGDGDGFIEVAEGLSSYGNILMPLTNVGGIDGDGNANFPLSDAMGNLNYDVTFDLNDAGNFEDPMNPGLMLDRGDIFPLDLREIVLHGMFVAPGPGAGTPNEVDGTNGYLATLPVASGQIVAVPEPASLGLLGLGGLALLRRRR